MTTDLVLRIVEDGGKTTWPNPLHPCVESAVYNARYAPENLTQRQAMALASIADAYRQLLAHSWGTEVSIKKLRKLRCEVLRDDDGQEHTPETFDAFDFERSRRPVGSLVLPARQT